MNTRESDTKIQKLGAIAGICVGIFVLMTLQEWQFTGEYFGPIFIVVIGTTFMAWAAKKDTLLPNWLCYWGMGCGV